MSRVIPSRFLFRYTFAIPYIALTSDTQTLPLSLGKEHVFPDLSALDHAPSFATLKLAWNETGLGLSLQVTGRQQTLRCDPDSPETSDGLLLWVDTRNTQTIHRAGRFCHAFCCLPTGGGSEGADAVVFARTISQAREDAPPPPPHSLSAQSQLTDDGYQLDAWIGATALHGWEIESEPTTGVAARLGFYWSIHDGEHGNQVLSVPESFPFAHDPSLWSTLELLCP